METKRQLGFTLIEMVVILAMMSIVSGMLILNFRSSATNSSARIQSANVMVGDIRRAQAMAVSGTTYQTNLICGFGVHHLSSTTYSIYARLINASVPCKTDLRSRNFDLGADPVVETKSFINDNMQIRGSFPDIFFELPDPLTFIDNSSSPAGAPSRIDIVAKGVLTPATQIVIYPSGKIDIVDPLP